MKKDCRKWTLHWRYCNFETLDSMQNYVINQSTNISTSLATWGSSWVSKEARCTKEYDFLGVSRCFSVRIEQTSKNHPKLNRFGSIFDVFEDSSILTERLQLEARKSNFLMNFASFHAQLDPKS